MDKEFHVVNYLRSTLSDFSALELYDSLVKLDKYIGLKLENTQTPKFWDIFSNLKTLRNLYVERIVNVETFLGINRILKEVPLSVLLLNDRNKFQQKTTNFGEYFYEGEILKTRVTEETKLFYLEKIDFFKNLEMNKTLTILSLEYIKIDKETLKSLQKFVINNSNLSEIYLQKNEMKSLEPFYDEMKETSNLKKLRITENDNLALDFKFLQFHKNLEEFHFRKNQNVDFFEFLQHVSKYSHNFLDVIHVDFIVQNNSFKNYPFPSLDLTRFKVSLNSSQISHLLKECSFLNLKSINLEHQKSFDSKNAELLRDLLNKSNSLKSLILKNLELNDQNFDIICDGIEKNESIKKINLGNNFIFRSFKKLNNVIKGKNLQKFMLNNTFYHENINYNDYSRYMNNIISTLSTFQSLSKMKLVNCNLDDDSAELISKLIKKTSYLNNLNISNNVFGLKGIQLICESMELNKTILKFKLGGTNFYKKGKYLFNLLEKNTYLKHIQLVYSDFSHDDVLLVIKGLGFNKGLETFYLRTKDRVDFKELTQVFFDDYLYFNYFLKTINFGWTKPTEYLDGITSRNKRFTKTIQFISNDQDIFFKFN